jgi:hypothetical protein
MDVDNNVFLLLRISKSGDILYGSRDVNGSGRVGSYYFIIFYSIRTRSDYI